MREDGADEIKADGVSGKAWSQIFKILQYKLNPVSFPSGGSTSVFHQGSGLVGFWMLERNREYER